MQVTIFLILVLIVSSACGTMTRNQVVEGDFEFFMDGEEKNNSNESLAFRRISWFRELTMQADLVYLNAQDFSKVAKVTSVETALKRCPLFVIVGLYNEQSSNPKKADIMAIFLNDSSVEKIAIEDARKVLASHPQFLENSFQLYDFHGLCFSRSLDSFNLDISGHKSVQMQF
jgi:hypothetical protein